ncbi:MAG: hypothetical protein GX620_00980 [Chloroflexi bacterium]|nr:hypothetical protein [Chloroflexota bacterium]
MGDVQTLNEVNRPAGGVTLDSILEGIGAVPTAVVQHALFRGDLSDLRAGSVARWIAALDQVHPHGVQIYSIAYPVAEAGIEPATAGDAHEVVEEVSATLPHLAHISGAQS